MVNRTQLRRSKTIQRRTGRTFHVATRLLPQRVRHQTYVLYAFFRLADDVVDDGSETDPVAKRETLERFRDEALGRAETDDPVLAAFDEVREEAGIRDDDVDAFVDAMLADLTTSRYRTYDDLRGYMDGSAAAVGRMMTAVMDVADPERARPHATALGEAFQLTNFVRDVREDLLELDRVYLPETTLDAHGVTHDDLRSLSCTPGVEAAVRDELRRAEALYREGVAGVRHLPEDCQFAVLLSAVLYAEHHRLIRERGYDVLSATPRLSATRKATLVARTWWYWRRTHDPEATFRRAACFAGADAEAGADAAPGGSSLGGRVADWVRDLPLPRVL